MLCKYLPVCTNSNFALWNFLEFLFYIYFRSSVGWTCRCRTHEGAHLSQIFKISKFWEKEVWVAVWMGRGFPRSSVVKKLPAKPETQVQSLVEKIPWKKIATHSSNLAWKIPWTDEPGGLQSTGLQKVGHDKWLSMHTHEWGECQAKKPVKTKRGCGAGRKFQAI